MEKSTYTLIANPFDCDLADFLIWRGIYRVPCLRGFITPRRRFCSLSAKEENAYIDTNNINVETHLNGWLLFKCDPVNAWKYIDEMSEIFGKYDYGVKNEKYNVIEQEKEGRNYVDLFVYYHIK